MLAARLEVRRLTEVGAAWFDAVVGPDWNVDRGDLVAIVVAEEEDDRSVLVRPPAFERGEDRLARRTQRLERERLPRLLRQRRDGGHRAGDRGCRGQTGPGAEYVHRPAATAAVAWSSTTARGALRPLRGNRCHSCR